MPVLIHTDPQRRKSLCDFPLRLLVEGSAIELTCDELEHCCGKNFVQWVDVCKGWQEEEA